MIQLLAGDCRTVLPTLAADSVQCVVTSPPYFALRDYGTAMWDGGDAACSHIVARPDRSEYKRNADGGVATWTNRDATPRQCSCGATRIDRQIGLEESPEAYLATMVAVFREVRRVMRNDAVAFINMGDSYQDKQLLMMPARLALALQADGWFVRSDIIWHKPNPMPESVTDRPTSAHEHVFLLTKRSRYYYDADAVREETSPTSHAWTPRKTDPERDKVAHVGNGHSDLRLGEHGSGRSCRNVWTLATESFSGAHFATFPSALAERCIRAGTSERGACSQCGAPWGRVVEREGETTTGKRVALGYSEKRGNGGVLVRQNLDYAGSHGNNLRSATTTGWAPGCRCNADVVPCTILDPFAGAGTSLLAADRLQRDAIGIELSPDYTRLAMQRCQDDAPLFTSFPPAETDAQDERMRDLFREAAD